jgi:CheY-like chemotaxis protein
VCDDRIGRFDAATAPDQERVAWILAHALNYTWAYPSERVGRATPYCCSIDPPVPRADNETDQFRVILADDHAPLRALLRELLGPRDCVVVGEAEDGARAVELVDEIGCDAVIMDLNMPVMNGMEATSIIRARHPDVHIVAFTSSTEPEIVAGLLSAGADAHFSKLDYNGLIDHLVSLRLQISGWEPSRRPGEDRGSRDVG